MEVTQDAQAHVRRARHESFRSTSKNLGWEDFDISRCRVSPRLPRLPEFRMCLPASRQNTHNRRTNAFRL